MELLFEGGHEKFRMVLDRTAKKLIVQSSNTNYQPKQMPWRMLFDKGKERVQELITDRYNDEEFITAVTYSMQILGYKRLSQPEMEVVNLPNAK